MEASFARPVWARLIAVVAVLVLPVSIGGPLTWHVPAALADPATSEKDAFDAAKELGTSEAWDAFLKAYPTGFRADLARAYLTKLSGGSAASPPSAAPEARAAAAEVNAQELPCSSARSAKSKESAEAATIRFINASGGTIVLQWIDFNGDLKEYATLEPGAELTQETFLTHPWIAAYGEGSCRQMFLPVKGTSVARLVAEEKLTYKPATDDDRDPEPSAEQACKDKGRLFQNGKCVAQASKPSKATVERRAKAACVEMGMAYINGKCAPKTKSERATAKANKGKACPSGMYRNPLGQCQPNETGG